MRKKSLQRKSRQTLQRITFRRRKNLEMRAKIYEHVATGIDASPRGRCVSATIWTTYLGSKGRIIPTSKIYPLVWQRRVSRCCVLWWSTANRYGTCTSGSLLHAQPPQNVVLLSKWIVRVWKHIESQRGLHASYCFSSPTETELDKAHAVQMLIPLYIS